VNARTAANQSRSRTSACSYEDRNVIDRVIEASSLDAPASDRSGSPGQPHPNRPFPNRRASTKPSAIQLSLREQLQFASSDCVISLSLVAVNARASVNAHALPKGDQVPALAPRSRLEVCERPANRTDGDQAGPPAVPYALGGRSRRPWRGPTQRRAGSGPSSLTLLIAYSWLGPWAANPPLGPTSSGLKRDRR